MKKSLLGWIVLFIFVVGIIHPRPAVAVTLDLYVGPNGDDKNGLNDCQDPQNPCLTIARASENINNSAITEGIIHLEPGTYTQGGSISALRNTTIQGAGIDSSFVEMNLDADNIAGLFPVLRIENLTLHNAGSVVWKDAVMNMLNVKATGHAFIFNNHGTVNISDSTFHDESTITNSGSPSSPGGLIFIDRVTFDGITPASGTGFLIVNGETTSMVITESSILGTNGRVLHNAGTMLISDTLIQENHNDSGLIINEAIGELHIVRSNIRYNEVVTTDPWKLGGSPIHNEGALFVEDSNFIDNRSVSSNGIFAGAISSQVSILNPSASAVISRSDFVGNYGNQGGAIKNVEGKLFIKESTIMGNFAEGDGGGVFSYRGIVVIDDSTISHNQAFLSPLVGGGFGGGITFFGFTAAEKLFINQSTIAENSAQEGGGVYLSGDGADVSLRNVTIAYNTIQDPLAVGAGVFIDRTRLETSNSIIALNGVTLPQSMDCGYHSLTNTVVSLGYNLDSDGSCLLSGNGDVTSANPKLDRLADNGGPTWTIRLLGGPAVDAADPNGCFQQDEFGLFSLLQFDQRLEPSKRHYDAGSGTERCDMGAYEAHEPIYKGG